MNLSKIFGNYIIWCGTLLSILLLAYTGYSKLGNIEVFRIQLYQSPIIPEVAVALISIALPIIEISICFLLIMDKSRTVGLYLSTHLFIFFTFYLLVLVLFFDSTKLPCSCGGIIGELSFPAHIAINVLMTIISFFAFQKNLITEDLVVIDEIADN